MNTQNPPILRDPQISETLRECVNASVLFSILVDLEVFETNLHFNFAEPVLIPLTVWAGRKLQSTALHSSSISGLSQEGAGSVVFFFFNVHHDVEPFCWCSQSQGWAKLFWNHGRTNQPSRERANHTTLEHLRHIQHRLQSRGIDPYRIETRLTMSLRASGRASEAFGLLLTGNKHVCCCAISSSHGHQRDHVCKVTSCHNIVTIWSEKSNLRVGDAGSALS